MSRRARFGRVTAAAFGALLQLAACTSGPPAPEWQTSAHSALDRAVAADLAGHTRVAETEFGLARREQDRPLLNKVFLSPDEPRPRAGWRLLLQTVFMVSIAVCLGILLFPALVLLDPTLLSSLADLPPQVLVLGMFVEAVAVTVSIFLARRFLDRRSIESLGLRFNTQALLDFLCGILITLVQIGLIYLLMFLLGWITFGGFAWQFDPIRRVITQSLLYLVLFILVAWREELLSRGSLSGEVGLAF